jgi:hypothetical protein
LIFTPSVRCCCCCCCCLVLDMGVREKDCFLITPHEISTPQPTPLFFSLLSCRWLVCLSFLFCSSSERRIAKFRSHTAHQHECGWSSKKNEKKKSVARSASKKNSGGIKNERTRAFDTQSVASLSVSVCCFIVERKSARSKETRARTTRPHTPLLSFDNTRTFFVRDRRRRRRAINRKPHFI